MTGISLATIYQTSCEEFDKRCALYYSAREHEYSTLWAMTIIMSARWHDKT